MANAVIMPTVGTAIREGIIRRWHTKKGQHVKKGDILATVIIDQIELEIRSEIDGYLLLIKEASAEKVPSANVIGYIGDRADENVSDLIEELSESSCKTVETDFEGVIENRTLQKLEEKIIKFSGMRKMIAERMMLSVHGMAHAYHKISVDMSEAKRYKSAFADRDMKISFTDIIMKAVCRALTEYPVMNSTLTENGIVLKDEINIGFAVALDNGLIVPNIKNAHLMSIAEISKESKRLVELARTRKLNLVDYSGGTFTLSNLGMYDLDEFTAIINPPEVGILAIGKIKEMPVVESGNVQIKPRMVICLTYDHRVVDGAPAAQFLRRIKQNIENPYSMI